MARGKVKVPGKRRKTDKKAIEQYDHRGKKRVNNPPVGLVNPETDKDTEKKHYKYDSHLDPQLQWAGKTEHSSFEIPTVSLHVHERIDPRTIIEAFVADASKQKVVRAPQILGFQIARERE